MLYACALNCIDGKTMEPVIRLLKQINGIDYVDMVTEPGINKILAQNSDKKSVKRLMKKVEISVKFHGSTIIAVVGHSHCAGNPSSELIQLQQLRDAKKRVKKWFTEIEVITLWVEPDEQGAWSAQEILQGR